MRNLRKARAGRKNWVPIHGGRSKEEGRMVRRFVWWWLTSRDPEQAVWSCLGQATRHLAHLAAKAGSGIYGRSEQVRRPQAYGDPTTGQLSRAREYTQQMRERGELRVSRRAKWEKFFERFPEAKGVYHSSGKFVNRLRRRRSAQTSHNPVSGW